MMGITRILRVVGLMAIGIGFTAADTVAPMITDAVAETDRMNNVDAATLPASEDAIGNGFPTSVNDQITDAAQPTQPAAVNGAVIDAASPTRETPGVYASDTPTTVNPQITDAAMTNVQTPGVYINEVDTASMAMGSEAGTINPVREHNQVDHNNRTYQGSKY